MSARAKMPTVVATESPDAHVGIGLSLEPKQMSSINGLGQPVPIQQTSSAKPAAAPDAAAPTRASDRVELSGLSPLLTTLKNNDVRVDKVAQIKAQIEAGSYDTNDQKLNGALDGLLDDLGT
jgi:flagellar biosynthesis anti-sigma factor FlgM